MRSLWAYVEGMDGLHLPFMGAKGSDLAAPGPGLALIGPLRRRLLLLIIMVRPSSSLPAATLYLGPMGSLWAYIEGMDVHCLLCTGTKGSDWLPGPDLAL